MIRQGEIWLVPVPFPDQSGLKLRPALVVSCAAQLQRDPDALVMAVTTRQDPPPPSLRLDPSDLVSGTLHRPSMLMCAKVFTVKQSLFRFLIGAVEPAVIQRALLELDAALGRRVQDQPR